MPRTFRSADRFIDFMLNEHNINYTPSGNRRIVRSGMDTPWEELSGVYAQIAHTAQLALGAITLNDPEQSIDLALVDPDEPHAAHEALADAINRTANRERFA